MEEAKKVRIYELAKQYEVSSKELIEELRGYGITVKNHMSSLDPETVTLIEAEAQGSGIAQDRPTSRKRRQACS